MERKVRTLTNRYYCIGEVAGNPCHTLFAGVRGANSDVCVRKDRMSLCAQVCKDKFYGNIKVQRLNPYFGARPGPAELERAKQDESLEVRRETDPR